MNNEEVLDGTFEVVMSVQGPIGRRGLPAFIQFYIDNGNLYVDEVYDDYTYEIKDGYLYVV